MILLLATSLSLSLISVDDAIAFQEPYTIPVYLPSSATIPLPSYGSTLYTEVDGDKFVIHTPSGAKIYNPLIYKATLGFEVSWNQKSIEMKNYRSLIVDVTLPSPQIPTFENLIRDYVIYLLPGMSGGYYYANQYGTPGEPGWQYLGMWPPPNPYGSILLNAHSVASFDEFKFQTQLRDTLNPSIQVARIKTEPHTASNFKITFWPHMENPSYSYGHTATLNWSGPFDLNIDGVEDESDTELFETWYTLRDSKADWDENGTINSADLDLFLSGIIVETPESNGGASEGGSAESGAEAAAGGCHLGSTTPYSDSPVSVVLFGLFLFFFFVRLRGFAHSSRTNLIMTNHSAKMSRTS